MTPQEIADRLHINHKTVVRHIRAGDLKAVRFGSRGGWRVRESDLMLFLGESTRQPNGQD